MAYISDACNSAPLNNMIAVYLHEEQPNGDVVVPFFKRQGDGVSIAI